MVDKGKLFERIGRKTTDLLSSGWVVEVIFRVAKAHSFEGRNGLFWLVSFSNRTSLTDHSTAGKLPKTQTTPHLAHFVNLVLMNS